MIATCKAKLFDNLTIFFEEKRYLPFKSIQTAHKISYINFTIFIAVQQVK